MIVTHKYGGTWDIHRIDNPGVRLSPLDMALAEAILKRTR